MSVPGQHLPYPGSGSSAALLAISDLHVRHKKNRAALETIGQHGDDWLILAGDIGETKEQLADVFNSLKDKFAKLLWVPGNHELWTQPGAAVRGEPHYAELVEVARDHGVVSPEDPYPLFEGAGGPAYVCPLFLLYDYSFRAEGISKAEALKASASLGVTCSDEWFLSPAPHPSREAWCAQRLELSQARLDALPSDVPKVLVNHFPLRQDLVRLRKIQSFELWCGTKETEDWHRRWNTVVCVHGHLHMRATDWRDGVRFEEVAVGYPRHWVQSKTWERYLRTILPGPPAPVGGHVGPIWHR